MITRCIICKKDAIVKDKVFCEPLSGEDSTAMYFRGWICEDCSIVNWAWDAEDESTPSDIS